jgi:2-polyprenyl-6-methoxyphenol hydroxylase-like FAD-dependent oxidoreductase
MRILIAGAGIAGLTLATLLHRQGHEVVVVEQRPRAGDTGYALALWPHGTRVLHAVGVYDEVVERSVAMQRYTARDERGRLLSSSALPPSVREYGHLGLLARGDLIGILRTAAEGADIRYGTTVSTVSAVNRVADAVEVRLSDGRGERVDVLIGADGIGSGVRDAIPGRAHDFDTGWACLVWWADSGLADDG